MVSYYAVYYRYNIDEVKDSKVSPRCCDEVGVFDAYYQQEDIDDLADV